MFYVYVFVGYKFSRILIFGYYRPTRPITRSPIQPKINPIRFWNYLLPLLNCVRNSAAEKTVFAGVPCNPCCYSQANTNLKVVPCFCPCVFFVLFSFFNAVYCIKIEINNILQQHVSETRVLEENCPRWHAKRTHYIYTHTHTLVATRVCDYK